MKIISPNKLINSWPNSLTFLQQRVLNYFPTHLLNSIWFPDIEIVFPDHLLNQNEIHIVLFGGFLERIFETGNWPNKKYHFWTLSNRVKEILTKMVSIPENFISVIPRNKIQSIPKKLLFLNFNQPINLIYAGRISSQKNIETFLCFASSLENKLDVNTYLLGNFDNYTPKNRGRFIITNYESDILNFIKELNFKNNPKILNNLNQSEWISHVPPNSIFINFSTFVCEDFGLALTEAHEHGYPLLISDWGGHADLIARNISFVPKSDIAESQNSKDSILIMTELLTKNFLNNKYYPKRELQYTEENFKLKNYLTLNELNSIRTSCISKYGVELSLLGQDRMALFASTKNGKHFFEVFDSIFSGKNLFN